MNPNEFTTHQYKLENNSCNNTTGNNSEMTTSTSGSLNEGLINNELIVLKPNNPVMIRFQNALKHHLLKQKENIKEELLTLDGLVRLKQNKKSSLINEVNNATCRVEAQHSLLNEFHQMKIKLESAKDQVEKCTNQGKQRYTEIITKTTDEIKKISVLKRQLDNSCGLLKELQKYEKEQEITFNMCSQKKSQTKQYKKKLLNDQQKKDLLLLSLTQEIIRLEDRMKQLGEQAETKYNERELLKQKVMDSSTDLDSLNSDNAKIALLWNGVLISIQQRDKSSQDIKNEFQGAKDKYQTLLLEANSYKRSVHEEFLKNEDIKHLLNKLEREQSSLQNTLKTCLDKFNSLKDKYSKLIQMTEFQNQNLDQILFEQKSLKNEINMLLHTFNLKSNQKLKYEEDILDELKKQLFSNKYCIQINNKISELKVQNKEHELILVEVENKLSRVSLKLEQCRTTSFSMEKDIEDNTKYLNDQGLVLSALDSELKKIFTEIHIKSKQIDLENKQLDRLKNKQEEGYALTPQMQIDQLQFKIDKVQNEIDSIKQFWVSNQNRNVKLLDQCNIQLNELNKVRKYALVMDKKNVKLKQEVINLLKEDDQYKRTLTNMRNTISKLNDNFSQNKGKSNQLLNENEWIQSSYIAELKENENQCLKHMDQLKHLKNELNEIKNMYIEKQRESKSWNTKVQFLVEIKREIKNKEGDSGDIEMMKNEIHRMQIRESQLKKNLENIMLDLEVCISRREIIYKKVAAKDTRSKGKNETKQKFLKKLNDLRINIKKVKIECKKLDQNMSDLQHYKMEIESKFTCLRNKLMQIQKDIDDLAKNIDENSFAKIKNVLNLSYKQSYAKFLDEVKKGKYRLLIKNELKMSEELATEWKKNSDLISIVEALKNDFPDLDFHITRLLCILKSINS